MLMQVVQRHRTALGHGDQGESVQSRVVDDSREIVDPTPQGEVRDLPIREPVASLVEADDRRHPPELHEIVPPHRTAPVELEMAQPARVQDDRGPVPVHGIRNPDAVTGATEPHPL